MSIFGPIHLQHWYPNYQNMDIYSGCYINVNMRVDPFAALVPKLPKSGYIFWVLYPMSIFGSIHLQHWYPNYQNLNIYIYIYIRILDITSRIHIHIWRPPDRLNGRVWGNHIGIVVCFPAAGVLFWQHIFG